MPNNDSRLRILLVIAGLPAGGAERQMSLLAKGLDRSKFEVGLLIFNSAEKIHYQDVFESPLWFCALNLSRASDGLLLTPKLVRGICRAIKDFKPDVIHTTLNVANHAVRFAAVVSICKTPVITSVRVEYRPSYSPNEKRLERLLWRRSSHIICNSETTREQLIVDLRIPTDRITSIPNGIDEMFYKVQPKRPERWPERLVALTVGRFTRQKNHLSLIESIDELEKKGVLADWIFVFLGDGPLQEAVQSSIDEHGLQDRIQIMPTTQDMPAVYQASELFILPSLYEGISNALLEAAASRCAVIVSKNADSASIINDERGWVAEKSLTDTLETVITLPKEERARKAVNSSIYVKRVFSNQRTIDDTAKVYQTVAKSAKWKQRGLSGKSR
jgi:glycosyltransferase involved in cell wall biosynthesis